MLTILLALTLGTVAPAPSAAASTLAPCETHTDSVSGYSRTICDGTVVRTCDAAGTCHGPASSY